MITHYKVTTYYADGTSFNEVVGYKLMIHRFAAWPIKPLTLEVYEPIEPKPIIGGVDVE